MRPTGNPGHVLVNSRPAGQLTSTFAQQLIAGYLAPSREGRPRKLTDDDMAAAKAMLSKSGEYDRGHVTRPSSLPRTNSYTSADVPAQNRFRDAKINQVGSA